MAITVVARVKARPGMLDVLQGELIELTKRSHEEPGCLHYSSHRGITPPDEFITIERWRDRNDLDQHMNMPFLVDLLMRLPEMVDGKPEIHIFEQTDDPGLPLARMENLTLDERVDPMVLSSQTVL